jgi:hypothetical protein
LGAIWLSGQEAGDALVGKPNFKDLTFMLGDGIIYYGRSMRTSRATKSCSSARSVICCATASN